jgi:anthraniloyl-CoA monooxygenase
MTDRRYTIVGDGPAGLYLAIELMRAGRGRQVVVSAARSALGTGIVLDADFVDLLEHRDPVSGRRIRQACRVWSSVRIAAGGWETVTGGHLIHGVSRAALIGILRDRAAELGVRFVPAQDDLASSRDADDADDADDAGDVFVGADGAGSAVRAAMAAEFKPEISESGSVYLWMRAGASFAPGFWVAEIDGGTIVAHVYPYAADQSALVVECLPAVARTIAAPGSDRRIVERKLTQIFADQLGAAVLAAVTFPWRPFRTVRAGRWHHGRHVLIGDAAHTTHYSVGSGTRLAVEDAIALAEALTANPDPEAAFAVYAALRRPVVLALQDDADSSRIWFEDIGRHVRLPADQFAFALRCRREVNTFGWLARRDPAFTGRVLRALAADRRCPAEEVPAGIAVPRLMPLRLGDRVVGGRIFGADSQIAVQAPRTYQISDGIRGHPDYVVVPVGDRGQRVERSRAAERLRNEHGLTVLLRVPEISDDEADTLIAAGRIDGCVVGPKGGEAIE